MAVDDLGDHVSEVGVRVDAVELAGFDQRSDDGPMFPATIRRGLIVPGFRRRKSRSPYPFHPLTGQTFVLAGRYEHGGVEHVLVRRKDGATFIFPAWMAGKAGLARIVADPRLPVNRLIELGELVDRIMIASSAGNPAAAGGHHEERNGCSTGSGRWAAARQDRAPIAHLRRAATTDDLPPRWSVPLGICLFSSVVRV
jgi:Family of unknown function (DUF5372)